VHIYNKHCSLICFGMSLLACYSVLIYLYCHLWMQGLGSF